ARPFRRVPFLGHQLARLVWVVQVLPVFLLPVPLADALIFGSMILAQGHLFLASDDDRNAARCLAAAPLLGVIALAYAPSTPLLVLLPVSCTVALTALVMLHGRIARRRIRRGQGLHERTAEVRSRVLYVVPLGSLALTLALVIFLAQERAFSGFTDTAANQASAAEPLDAPLELPAVGRYGDGPGGQAGGYLPDMPFSGGSLPFSPDPVMKVWPIGRASEGAATHGLYLRDVVLDDFGPAGIGLKDRSLPTTYSDADDGELDGWTWVIDRADPESEWADWTGETLRYEVLARPLLVDRLGWTLLFSPHPMAAIRLPRVRYGADQILVSPRRHDDWFDYGLQVVDRGLTAGMLRRERAVHVDPQYVQLPARDAALAAVASLARDLTRGATSDYERVRRVVDHLLDEFTYDLADLDFEGTRALARFLQTKRGYCTHFASTATLLLRTQGIACRVATGFTAHEWLPEERAWLVRERDAHAWMEVYFEDAGWVAFDPTPGGGPAGRASAALDPLQEERQSWSERLSEQLAAWLDAEGQGGSLGAVLATLSAGPLAALRELPALWWVLSAALLLAAHWLWSRRRPPMRWNDSPLTLARPTQALYQRLARALAAHGFQRRLGQTPREFALAVCSQSEELFAPLRPVTELYYRARFGGRDLAAEEERFVERLVRALEE
ncbi:MAG: transglutaminase domain-containing protein, partial [Planctomycetota bacterium]